MAKFEKSVPFDDQNALNADTSERDVLAENAIYKKALAAALKADTSEADALYERDFAANRAKALAGDKSEQNRWKRGK